MVPYAFILVKCKTMHFSETNVVYDLKLATDDRSDKKQEVSVDIKTLSPGAIYMYLIMKKIVLKPNFKEISLKLATKG